MKRRVIALLCLVAVLIGVFAVSAAASTQKGDAYLVGYAKKDVNPWIQSAYTGPNLGIPAADVKDADGNFIDGIVPVSLSDNNTGEQQYIVSVPLSGYGNITTDRNADKMTDDNGDGILGLGDGVFTTATAVSDDWGTTVIFVTIDNINGVSQMTDRVRTAVVKALGGAISADQIMISANHSHEAPTINTCYSSWNTNMNPDNANRTGKVTALGVYWLYYLDQVVAACKEAYENRSEATMSKGSIDATAVTGHQMNFVRHYKATVEKQEAKVTFWTQGSWSTKSTVDAYVGDNFGATGVTSETKYSGFSGTSKRTVSTIVDHATQSDDTMYLLKFDRAESAGNDIVLVNWKAHASNNGHSYFKNLSSDYINALRYRLENNTDFGGDQNYCVGFWMGASGNYNNSSRIASEYTYDPYGTQAGWPTIVLNDKGEGNDVKVPLETDATGFFADYYASILNSAGTGNGYADEFYRSALYGYILGKVALAALSNNMTAVDHGSIRTVQNNYAAATRTFTDAEIAAANEWQQQYNAGNIANKNAPFTASNGTVLNSYYHAYSILNRSTASSLTMELNVITMGKNVALVTGTGELFDNYDINGSTNPLDNDWLELINCVEGSDFGTPFVLSYSNNSTGYAPNVLAYDYYTDTTATVAAGTAMGSYEANTTTLARGTGEAVIQEYKKMLTRAYSDYLEYECPECGEEALWKPLGAEQANYTPGQGHYYLTEDLNGTGMAGQKSLGYSDGSLAIDVCIDLNGYTFSSESRCFIIYNKCKLSIFDMRDNVPGKNSGSTGMMVGHSFSNNPGGGAFSVNGGATVNLYGGTLKFVKVDNPSWYGTGTGGTFSLAGTLNVYGGRIEGGDMVKSTYGDSYYGLGGAVYLNSGGTINMTGGTITSGSVPEGGLGPCVYMVNKTTSKINLSGDASIEDIYYRYNGGSALKISGKYTGSLGLTFHSDIALTQGLDIGDVTSGTDIAAANITVADTSTKWKVAVSATNLVLRAYSDNVKAVIIEDGIESEYTTLAAAVKVYSGGYIKLLKNDSSTFALSRDVYLDLNGCSATGIISANNGTLYCFDSQTDDYTVKDGVYGKLTKAKGNVLGLPVESELAEDGYLMVTESSGVSFHRVNLRITHMSLRQRNEEDPSGVYNPGVYYKAVDSFAADEVAAAKIQKFGIAMSAIEEPNAENLEEKCGYSWFDNFVAGKDSNKASGTLLRGVLKETNASLINRRNATTKVYGRAYILTEDGYMFGDCVIRTFREQVEAVDAMWSTLSREQKDLTLEMYKTYSSVMASWNIPNMLEELNSDEYKTLKVLVVGNSHGLDATNLLYEVFKAEAPEQDVVIGALYYSGCNINQHANYMKTDAAVYEYYKNGNYEGANADGSWQITKNATAAYGIGDEQWDIVVMQQMNHRSAYDGAAENNFNKTNYQYVINYIKDHVKGGAPKLAWHMVWTNPDQEEYLDPNSALSHPTKTSTDWVDNHTAWFPGEDGKFDQSVMYQGIVNCLKEYIIDEDSSFLGKGTFDYILPSALAVEYAQDVLGCTQAQIYRDYTHMNDYGRLMTAYLWYAELMGIDEISEIKVGEIPAVLHHSKSTILGTNAAGNYVVAEDMQEIIRKAVNFALENPEDYAIPAK